VVVLPVVVLPVVVLPVVVLPVQSTDHLPTQKVTVFALARRFVTDAKRLMPGLMKQPSQAE